ncbi:hypothetical protein [Bacillus massilinigeriensis]|uniref:hypothetical protein n=1 Tax=Bacillus mediterraneensis TaxID=1805474 RepID=UPI0008F961E6|nr:hypothetical protein [Bacillus mediterraneensis]
MKLKKGNFSKLILAVAITLSIFSFNVKDTEAAQVDEVLVRWYKTYSSQPTFTHGHVYKTLSYINGYTYKQSSKDITTWTQKLMGMQVIQYDRTYSTY